MGSADVYVQALRTLCGIGSGAPLVPFGAMASDDTCDVAAATTGNAQRGEMGIASNICSCYRAILTCFEGTR